MYEAQCCCVQSSAWRSRPSFKWGPEGTQSWTAGHIQREFPHIMGSNTRCRENRGCLLCWLTLHPLTPCRIDIDCVWSVPASSTEFSEVGLKKPHMHFDSVFWKFKIILFICCWNISLTIENYCKLLTASVFRVFDWSWLPYMRCYYIFMLHRNYTGLIKAFCLHYFMDTGLFQSKMTHESKMGLSCWCDFGSSHLILLMYITHYCCNVKKRWVGGTWFIVTF